MYKDVEAALAQAQSEPASTRQLLAQYASLLETLRSRGVLRSANNPVADYTERLVAVGLGLKLVANSTAGYDALDPATGEKYEIKGRRISHRNVASMNPQVSAIRNLDAQHFDFLVGVVFNEDFSVERAVKIPSRSSRRFRPMSPTQTRTVCGCRSRFVRAPTSRTSPQSCAMPRYWSEPQGRGSD